MIRPSLFVLLNTLFLVGFVPTKAIAEDACTAEEKLPEVADLCKKLMNYL